MKEVGLEETGSEVEELEEVHVQEVLEEDHEEEGPERQGREEEDQACVRGKVLYCEEGVAQILLSVAADHGVSSEGVDL